MSEEKKSGRISRREFLRDAGLIVGGVTVGSMALANACGGATVTVTSPGGTATKTVTSTATTTTTVGTGGATVTTTVTAPGGTGVVTKTVTVQPTGTGVPVPGGNFVTLNVNGEARPVAVEPYWPLSFVLRDKLGLFGTKVGCEFGQCASCTVLQDGVPVLSCLTLAIEAQGKQYTTVEGLSNGTNLTPLQQKWYDNEAFQCGFCTSGFMMAATALLAATPRPTVDQVREAFSGHICTCGNFKLVIENTAGGVS